MRRFQTGRRFWWMVCAALVFAQTVALVHAFWHASEDVGIDDTPAQLSDPQRKNTDPAVFCSLDALLGQLLTAAPGAHDGAPGHTPAASAIAQPSPAFRAAHLLAPRSRGPPVSL